MIEIGERARAFSPREEQPMREKTSPAKAAKAKTSKSAKSKGNAAAKTNGKAKAKAQPPLAQPPPAPAGPSVTPPSFAGPNMDLGAMTADQRAVVEK
ncbi:MAG TPA: hypothetical protein VKO16_03490, partial [Polyangia bacterium]|nr:hypothetical protein [Polyangia bacterium]